MYVKITQNNKPRNTKPLPKVSCGLFGISEDHIEGYQSLDDRFVKNKASTFFFEATGDSMQPLIFAKDVLVVDRSISVFPGCVAVISVDGEMFCKRLKWGKEGELILQSDNSQYKDKIISEHEEVLVFGVVVSVVRELIPFNHGPQTHKVIKDRF